MKKLNFLKGALCLFAALSCNSICAESVGYSVNSSTGSFTAGSGNYRYQWTYTTTDANPAPLVLEVSGGANNMNTNADGSLQLHSGSTRTSTYVLSVPAEYIITGYSFNYSLGNSGTSTNKVFTINGTAYPAATSSAQSITIQNLATSSTSFVLTGANEPVKMSNFVVNVEVNPFPYEGKYYRFSYDYGTNGGVKYMQSTASGASDAAAALLMSEEKGIESIFTVEGLSNGTLKLKSYSTGKYVKEDTGHRGLHDTANNVTFSKGTTDGKIKIRATSYLHANYKNSKYYVDHCTNDGCAAHNFSFEEVPQYTLTVTGSDKVSATATWNGETKTLPATWTVLEGVEISDSELVINTISEEYVFAGLSEGETSLGTTITISSLTASRTISANFNPIFFSSTYGEKWVRMRNCSNENYWATVVSASENAGGKTATLDYANENELWCLVGNANEFKLYNKAAGENLTLGVSVSSYASGNLATLMSTETTWKLKEQEFGYALLPSSHSNTSEFGINMWEGANGDLKLYTTGSNNTGSYWTMHMADVSKALTFSIDVQGTAWSNQLGVADLTFVVDGVTTSIKVTESVESMKLYLPMNAVFSLSSYTYRGYTFNGFGEADRYTDQVIPEGGLTIAASYTANNERTLYYTPTNGHPYRIPAIATAPNGNIFAISDYRPCGNDIGYGEVDIKCRISTDNGLTWGDEFFIANGNGGNSNVMETGYGDAAVVADREQNKLLVMMVCGRTVCHNGRWDTSKIGDKDATAVNRVARVYATYNEQTQQWDWTTPVEVTDDIYSLFLNGDTPTVTSMFIGSGKICQSRVVKKGDYYRLYCSMWTRDGGNRVIYSDDFGGTWYVLGSITDRPAPSGDEPKVEELPDGTVLLSSRKGAGRYFNLYKYTDNTYTAGAWGTVASSNDQTDGLSFGGNSTNGEVLLVKAKNTNGDEKKLMLQSVPTGSGRSNVSIFYKELDEEGKNYTPITFSQGWTMGLEVSQRGSAYSTMIEQADGRIAFLFEEEPGNYCIVYIPLTIEQITSNAYTTIKPEGPSVGIVEIESMSQIVSELYDLQGRKVLHPVKGHLYVQNGRKFIQH